MSEGRLYLELITRRRCVFEGFVTKVILPSKLGQMCILPGHAALLAVLIPGVFRSTDVEGKEIVYAVKGGFVQVQGESVKVMVERAWSKDELSDPPELDPLPKWNPDDVSNTDQTDADDGPKEDPLDKVLEEAYLVRLLNEAKIKVKAGL
ncbi:F0F1 ATP synthase subunit epsilon [bacterium]|nr:F0F1 ATP synthase subunit epsilon [bacterium]